MKDFRVRVRDIKEKNYHAVWSNLKTIRTGTGEAKELDPLYAEFYDIGLGNRCDTGRCPFCYVKANSDGRYYSDVLSSWRLWMKHYTKDKEENGIILTEKPFQVSLGSTGEPTEHPEFCELLEDIYSYDIVPNFTTNGVIISSVYDSTSVYHRKALRILDRCSEIVGGVAVSYGNIRLRKNADQTVKALIEARTPNINLHHIIWTSESVKSFIESWKTYGDKISYHVLLPMMYKGVSMVSGEVFKFLVDKIKENGIENIAFGANFYEYLQKGGLETWIYPPESFSKNMILGDGKVIITKSSFDLKPILTISL